MKRDFGTSENLTGGSQKLRERRPSSWAISHPAVAPLAMAFDALIIILASVLSSITYQYYVLAQPNDIVRFATLGTLVAVLFITAGKIHDRYDASELLNFKLQVREVTVFWAATFLLLAGVSYAMKIGANFSRGSTLSFAFSGLTGLIAARIVWRIVLANGLAIRRFSGRKIALITDEYVTANSETLGVCPNTAWLQRIILYSQTMRKVARKLLNQPLRRSAGQISVKSL